MELDNYKHIAGYLSSSIVRMDLFIVRMSGDSDWMAEEGCLVVLRKEGDFSVL